MNVSKTLVFFFLFLVAMVIFPSFAAFIGSIVGGAIQFICLIVVVNIVLRLVFLGFQAAYNLFAGKEESEGAYSYN